MSGWPTTVGAAGSLSSKKTLQRHKAVLRSCEIACTRMAESSGAFSAPNGRGLFDAANRRLHLMSKATRLSILAPLALAWLCGSALAQVTNSTKNPKQVATLHWYQANQTANFAVGVAPSGTPATMAFDGANLWVTDFNTLTVSKVRPSDGAVLGVFSVGPGAAGVAFDGVNIWVANNGDNTLSKLRASDGTVLARFSLHGSPVAVLFDGINIWVSDLNDNLLKLRPSDGMQLGGAA